jgi:hypothetical protein
MYCLHSQGSSGPTQPTIEHHIPEHCNPQIFNLLDCALHRNMYYPENSLQNWTVTHRIMMFLLAHKVSEEMLAVSAELWHLHQQQQGTSNQYSNYCCVHRNTSAITLPMAFRVLGQRLRISQTELGYTFSLTELQNRSLDVWYREIMVATWLVHHV